MCRRWLGLEPVKKSQHWYQSPRFDSWNKSSREGTRVTLNKKFSQRCETTNGYKKEEKQKRLSNFGKQLLKDKLNEVISFNTSKNSTVLNHSQPLPTFQGKISTTSRKEKRSRCYLCKVRGHFYWNCNNKKHIDSEKPMENKADMEEVFNWPSETIHVETDYMIRGTDKGNWNNIWYVSKSHAKHMTPSRYLFKRMLNQFKVVGRDEKVRKFIIAYGVGVAIIDNKEEEIVIPSVLYTPEITMNVLSMKQLEDQGFVVTCKDGTCQIKYMFDKEEEAVDKGDEEAIKDHQYFMEEYYRSLDPSDERSLIKGMEDLEMNKDESHDYVDDEYLSLNGALYHLKVNTFPRFLSFLDLVKIDKLVFKNWEIMEKKFIDLLRWFYYDYMRMDALGDLPPVIGVIRIDLLALYKFVDDMGGYMNVSFNDLWGDIALPLGLTREDGHSVKECYREYIALVKVYYEEARRVGHGEPRLNMVGDVPCGDAKTSVYIRETQEEKPKKRFKYVHDEVKKEEDMECTTSGYGKGNASSKDDFIIVA